MGTVLRGLAISAVTIPLYFGGGNVHSKCEDLVAQNMLADLFNTPEGKSEILEEIVRLEELPLRTKEDLKRYEVLKRISQNPVRKENYACSALIALVPANYDMPRDLFNYYLNAER